MSLEKTDRGVKVSYGPRGTSNALPTQTSSEIAQVIRKAARTKNAFIKEYPTLLVKPYDRESTQLFTDTLVSGGTISASTTILDPTTGSPMAKVLIPDLNTAYQAINYTDVDLGYFDETDVWLISVYIPQPIQTTCVIQLLTTNTSGISGTNIRTYQFNPSALQQGYNILSMLHVEELIGSTTYGKVGTNIIYQWINGGSQSPSTAVNSMRIRTVVSGGAAGDTEIYFGAIFKAPKGWSRAGVVWQADDVPISFYNLAIPIIESYGWKTTLNAAVGLTELDTYISIPQYQDLVAQGHEVWGHTYNHENLTEETADEETRVLTISRNFWNSIGMTTASRFMAYPNGAFDADTITTVKSLGYRLASTVTGTFNSPWIPSINPYTISRFTTERLNSWQVDAIFNGGILRGQSMFTYMHNAVEGGSTSNTRPSSVSFYTDHLKRWCDLVKSYEEQDMVIVTTASEYYHLCGVDPLIDTFLE